MRGLYPNIAWETGEIFTHPAVLNLAFSMLIQTISSLVSMWLVLSFPLLALFSVTQMTQTIIWKLGFARLGPDLQMHRASLWSLQSLTFWNSTFLAVTEKQHGCIYVVTITDRKKDGFYWNWPCCYGCWSAFSRMEVVEATQMIISKLGLRLAVPYASKVWSSV